MSLHHISMESQKTNLYLTLFKQGNQRAMDFIYRRSFHSLLLFGKGLIDDEFLVSCILHECYLKAWEHRQRMQSLAHIYRFIRMNLRWQILRHIEQSRRTIYGQTLLVDHFDKTIGDFEDPTEDIEKCEQDILRLEMITESMKYLPLESGQIASLYFKQGLTRRQIANRLGTNTRQISCQIERSIEQIKSIVHAAPIKNHSLSQTQQVCIKPDILDDQQAMVYDLRKNHKLSFGDIARRLGFPQTQVQQQYIKAHQLIEDHNAEKKTRRF
jgi:DNA-directed RNA polymerase specialized sigma subunit